MEPEYGTKDGTTEELDVGNRNMEPKYEENGCGEMEICGNWTWGIVIWCARGRAVAPWARPERVGEVTSLSVRCAGRDPCHTMRHCAT